MSAGIWGPYGRTSCILRPSCPIRDPIYMTSHVKYSPQNFIFFGFSKLLRVSLRQSVVGRLPNTMPEGTWSKLPSFPLHIDPNTTHFHCLLLFVDFVVCCCSAVWSSYRNSTSNSYYGNILYQKDTDSTVCPDIILVSTVSMYVPYIRYRLLTTQPLVALYLHRLLTTNYKGQAILFLSDRTSY